MRLGKLRAVSVAVATALGAGLLAAGPALATGPGRPARPPAGPTAAGTPHYPVTYTFLAGIAAAPRGPDTPPPGADIWSCKPSTAHPQPVVLVHGLFANETDNWQTISPLLADNGYCVFSLTYGQDPGATTPPLDEVGGLMPMEQSALQLSAFVDKVLAATGAAKVDLVGHSEGATMPDYYIDFDGGAAKVARFVGIAPVVHGTNVAGTATLEHLAAAFGLGPQVAGFAVPACGSCQELVAGSAFITKLDAAGIVVPGVTYTQIVTRYDELVVPYTSGEVNAANVTNIVVQDQCPLDFSDHLAIVADPTAAADVLNALDPAHPRPVPCTPVLPVIG